MNGPPRIDYDSDLIPHVQWSAVLTWPNGYTETHRQEHRLAAEAVVDKHNSPFGRKCSCAAELKGRVVVVGPWVAPDDIPANLMEVAR